MGGGNLAGKASFRQASRSLHRSGKWDSDFAGIQPPKANDAEFPPESAVDAGLQVLRRDFRVVGVVNGIRNPLDNRLAPGRGNDLAGGMGGVAVGADTKGIGAGLEDRAGRREQVDLADVTGDAGGPQAFAGFGESRLENPTVKPHTFSCPARPTTIPPRPYNVEKRNFPHGARCRVRTCDPIGVNDVLYR